MVKNCAPNECLYFFCRNEDDQEETVSNGAGGDVVHKLENFTIAKTRVLVVAHYCVVEREFMSQLRRIESTM